MYIYSERAIPLNPSNGKNTSAQYRTITHLATIGAPHNTDSSVCVTHRGGGTPWNANLQ